MTSRSDVIGAMLSHDTDNNSEGTCQRILGPGITSEKTGATRDIFSIAPVGEGDVYAYMRA